MSSTIDRLPSETYDIAEDTFSGLRRYNLVMGLLHACRTTSRFRSVRSPSTDPQGHPWTRER